MVSLKIVAVGDCDVGKRCLLRSYVEGRFPEDDIKNVTHGYSKDIYVCNRQVKLVLWDANSKDEYARLRPLTYPLTDVFLLCFSLFDVKSFESIETVWYPEITRHCPQVPFLLVGTKCDKIIGNERGETNENKSNQVSKTKAYELASKINAFTYIECSALTRESLNEVFTEAIRAVICPRENLDLAQDKQCCLM